jgi:hypothetical protein
MTESISESPPRPTQLPEPKICSDNNCSFSAAVDSANYHVSGVLHNLSNVCILVDGILAFIYNILLADLQWTPPIIMSQEYFIIYPIYVFLLTEY